MKFKKREKEEIKRGGGAKTVREREKQRMDERESEWRENKVEKKILFCHAHYSWLKRSEEKNLSRLKAI